MEDSEGRAPRRWWLAGVALFLSLLLVSILWLGREPIARRFVDAELTARQVPASYVITRLAPGVQRLERIVIGDPAHPDLTAEWAELRLSYGLGWPSVRSITAGGVRLRGRLVAGKVSFGTVDRLLPPSSDAPFALPDITVNLADARMRLDTPYGAIGLALEGRGNLANGFDGRLAAIATRLGVEDCGVVQPSAWLHVAIADRAPRIEGPARAARIDCGDASLADARIDLAATLNEALDRWRGQARIATGKAEAGANRLASFDGTIGFDGGAERIRGTARLTGEGVVTPQGAARQVALDTRYDVAPGGEAIRLDGDARIASLALAPALLRRAATGLAAAGGTPLGPLGQAIGAAIARAGRDSDVDAGFLLDRGAGGGSLLLRRIGISSASGARLALGDGNGMSYRWPDGARRIDGRLTLAGGGFPTARIDLRQAAAHAPLTGVAEIAPMAVGGSRLALAPVRFSDAGRVTRFETVATLDGPIGDGRVTGLRLPLSGRVAADGSFAVNERCVPLDFATLVIAGVRLGTARLPLCPVQGALIARGAGGALRGGAAIARPRLAGRVGQSPLLMTAAVLRADIGSPGFTLDRLAVRLGAGKAVTRLDITRLAGKADARGLGGRFEGAAGKIANVPLLISEAGGGWRLANGNLALDGRLRVADDAAEPRFNPLVSDDVRLTLVGGVIRGGGTLREPTQSVAVTRVELNHDLSRGTGGATLDVPALTFREGFQPELLTRLTLGVVANVVGTVSGRGEIAWGPDGVTSGGTFSTESTALAAAFGPVSGINGTIRFTDLLGLVTAPEQEVRLGEVNPGIAVTGGVVRYQLLPDQHVRIEGGEWPFSGGRLVLEPTTLDLGRPVERHLTFRVEGLDAALFLQQFEFDNVAATGLFDGRLPMVFDERGGRIERGRLDVRRGGGTLAYVGEVSNEDLGTFGTMAFDALKSMRYENLAIELDGALDGEIISRILFTGTNERPIGEGAAPAGITRQFTGLPFKFNIVVRAPFRGLLNTASNFADPTALIRDQAGQLAPGAEQPAAVQPQESGNKP